uniref:Transcriptional adaptor 2B n=3 Tax=Equus TaxID=9789 RepID=A0A9L0S7G0_HORSE
MERLDCALWPCPPVSRYTQTDSRPQSQVCGGTKWPIPGGLCSSYLRNEENKVQTSDIGSGLSCAASSCHDPSEFAPLWIFAFSCTESPKVPSSIDIQEDMAAHVGASRTPQEVMEHYVSMYIHGNLGKACIPDTIPNRVTDHTCPSGGPLSPSLTTPLPPLDISVAEQQQLGYMPLRDDYEIEYDQDAETLISGLSVNYDDDDVEIELKRAHVDMYVRKLKERQRRKNIARDYNLVPAFLGKDKKEKEKTAKRKITKEEKELRLKLRPLYQFMSCKEFDDLFENMHKEKMLRAKIRELQRYRRNGITKMEESAEYEAARHKREKRKENKTTAGSKRGKEDGKESEFAAIENLPGFELLSDREKVLCSSLNLSPARYVTVKTIIIKDHLQKRQGIPSKSRLPSYLDKVLKKRILTFLTESGWISRDAS